MLPNPVAYLIHRNGSLPAIPAGKAFAYVLAGNGLFKRARNRHVDALIPLATSQVAGLQPLTPYVHPLAGHIPGQILHRILHDARRRSWNGPREAMYHVTVENNRVRVFRPPQQAGAANLAYTGGDDPNIVLDLHSHQEMDAFYSSTDNRDEQGFRFYAVIGRIFTRPEIILRLGMYGDFYRLPVTTLFTDLGAFQEWSHTKVEEKSSRNQLGVI